MILLGNLLQAELECHIILQILQRFMLFLFLQLQLCLCIAYLTTFALQLLIELRQLCSCLFRLF